MNNAEKTFVEQWAKAWREDNLTQEMRILILLAVNDLWTGGGTEEDDYPGFTAACKRIRAALEALPAAVYVNAEYGGVREDDPSDDTCDCAVCDGSGQNERGETCAECEGSGRLPEGPEDWLSFDSKALRAYIVGRDLAEYL